MGAVGMGRGMDGAGEMCSPRPGSFPEEPVGETVVVAEGGSSAKRAGRWRSRSLKREASDSRRRRSRSHFCHCSSRRRRRSFSSKWRADSFDIEDSEGQAHPQRREGLPRA